MIALKAPGKKILYRCGFYIILIIPFIIGLCGYPLHTTGFDLSRLPGDFGDSRLINYILEHGYQFIIGNRESFYNAPFFYPEKNVISLSDNMIGHLPFYAMFRFSGFSRETAYQLWWLSVFALNYFISFFCFKKFSGSIAASVIMAWLFTFWLLNYPNINYTQINAKFMLPVVLINFLQWLNTGHQRYFIFTLIAFALQLTLSVYFFIFLLLFLAVILIVHTAVTREFFPYSRLFLHPVENKGSWIAIALLAGFSALYLHPNYSLMGNIVKFREYASVYELIPKPQSFISACLISRWSGIIGTGSRFFPGNWWYHPFFPGIFPFIVLIAGITMLIVYRKAFSKQVRIVFISFVLLFFICVRWTDKFSPLEYLYDIHLFGPISFPSRVIVPLEVLFLLFAGSVIAAIFSKMHPRLKVAAAILLIAFVTWDNALDLARLNSKEKTLLIARYGRIKSEIKNQQKAGAKTMVVLKSSDDQAFILDAMMVSQSLNMNCINGYSSNAPSGPAAEFWVNSTREQLRKYCKVNRLDTAEIAILNNPN